MTEVLIYCPMCGYKFNPSSHAACQSCPLNNGCQLICCPACGFETIDPDNSMIIRIVKKLIRQSPGPANQIPLLKDNKDTFR